MAGNKLSSQPSQASHALTKGGSIPALKRVAIVRRSRTFFESKIGAPIREFPSCTSLLLILENSKFLNFMLFMSSMVVTNFLSGITTILR